MRTETRSITIAAPPAAVIDVIGDATMLPRWAPNFTGSVQRDGDDWVIDGGRRIRLLVAPEQGTVDIVAAAQPTRGAFSRVLPNGDGSEYLFTLLFPDGTDAAAVDRQMAIVEEELEAVRGLAQAQP